MLEILATLVWVSPPILGALPVFARGWRSLIVLSLIAAVLFAIPVWQLWHILADVDEEHPGAVLLLGWFKLGYTMLAALILSRTLGLLWQARGATRLQAFLIDGAAVLAVVAFFAL